MAIEKLDSGGTRMATTEADKQELLGLGLNYSLGEASGGIALIVLSILALAKMDPMLLNAIAVILAGIALLIEEGSLLTKYAGASSYAPAYGLPTSTAPDGVSAGTVAGVSGIVLGILAILGIAAAELTAVAIIIFGAALLFDFAAKARIMAVRMMDRENSVQSARFALTAASNTNTSAMLVGVALITLGILALAGLTTSILVTVALLGLGAYLFLQNAAVAGWLFGTAS
jgi:hypothetical protein